MVSDFCPERRLNGEAFDRAAVRRPGLLGGVTA